jgi:hypothetical protein
MLEDPDNFRDPRLANSQHHSPLTDLGRVVVSKTKNLSACCIGGCRLPRAGRGAEAS